MARDGQGGSRLRKARSGSSGPTIADVARHAGVSPMTVSRVVNREGNVLPGTTEKVEEAIKVLGYVPNVAARSLAGGKQCRIALLHSNPSAAYLSEFLMGSLAQASVDNAQIVVEYCDDADTVETLAGKLKSHRVDAVLLPPPLCDNAGLISKIHDLGLPMAQIATGRPSPDAYAVIIDDRAAAKAMTEHLISLGHKRIGFIAGNENQTASALRQAGFEAALREAGIVPERELIRPGDFSYRSGLAAAEELLSSPKPPTAIFASNDDMAAAAVAVAHRHRLDVPEDISVCGFDDSAMATTIWPELTTVRQPVAEMAKAATALLAEDVKGRSTGLEEDRHRMLAYEIVRRDSDGSPRPNG